jgi:hypothetical protein
MDNDLTLELKRGDFGQYLLTHPGASRDEIIAELLRIAVDKRSSPPGRGLIVHDDTGGDYPLDEFLKLVRHEIETGVIHPARRAKIVIDLPPDAAKELDQLMRQTGDDPTALFQKSLALYRLAKEAIRGGKSVGIVSDPESLETRFVGL